MKTVMTIDLFILERKMRYRNRRGSNAYLGSEILAQNLAFVQPPENQQIGFLDMARPDTKTHKLLSYGSWTHEIISTLQSL